MIATQDGGAFMTRVLVVQRDPAVAVPEGIGGPMCSGPSSTLGPNGQTQRDSSGRAKGRSEADAPRRARSADATWIPQV